ncbi:MAG: response regulator [Candidatus Electryoneaceae bacterium]|nr:response regulator [Candidatus Electryoneaceae bacterium]
MAETVQKKILIVDDEPDVVIYLKTFLEDNGFITVSAENGREGMEKAVAELPDLITLDITMPEQSGVRMFRDLQKNEATSKIPVIIITGVTLEFKKFIETRRQVDPPTAYFEKPIERSVILSKVNEILGL